MTDLDARADRPALPADHTPSDADRRVLAVGSVLALAGAGLVFGWAGLRAGDELQDIVTGPGQIIGCAVATVGLVCLVVALPRVLGGFPRWAVTATVAGLVFAVVDAWYNATTGVAVAGQVGEADYTAVIESLGQFVMLVPKMLLGAAGLLGLALAGRQVPGLVSRPVAVLLGLAALASLVPPFMPGVLLASVAFLLLSRRPGLQ